MNADIAHGSGPGAAPVASADALRHFAVRLSATRRGARLARRLASRQLDVWGRPYDAEGNRTASLLVAEPAANAVLHGRVPGRDFRLALALRLEAGVPVLRIEVTDARPERRPPAPGTLEPPGSDAETGRGLLLVAAPAVGWGVARGDGCGKTVWCEVVLA